MPAPGSVPTRYRELLAVGIPLLLAAGISLGTSVVDTALMSRYAIADFAGVAAAVAVYEIPANLVAAFLMGHQILVSQRFGAGDDPGAGRTVSTNLVLSLLLSGALLLVMFLAAEPLVRTIVDDPGSVEPGVSYLRARVLGLPLFALMLTLMRTFHADQRAVVSLQATIVMAASLITLDTLLIYGLGPFPELGALGNGIASVLAVTAASAFLVGQAARHRLFARLGLSRRAVDRATVRQSVEVSWPLVLSGAGDYVGSYLFFVIIGWLSVVELAGGRIAFQVALVFMTLTMGLSGGGNVMMARAAGAEDPVLHDEYRRRNRELLVALTAAGAVVLALAAVPILWVFTDDGDVIAVARPALLVIALSLPVMGWCLNWVAVLRSKRRTKADLLANLSAVWLVQLPVAAGLILATDLGLDGAFVGLLAYWLVRGLLSSSLANRKERPAAVPEEGERG